MVGEGNAMPSLEQGLAALKKRRATVVLPQVWVEYGLPVPESEYRFCPGRLWRIDYAFAQQKVAIEIEGILPGGGGRHQRFKGYRGDCEKYNALTEGGWALLRYMPKRLDFNQIKRVLESRG